MRSAPVDDDHRRVGHLGVADDLAREQLARPPRLLRRHDRGELTAYLVADDRPRGVVHPAHETRPVEHVGRDVDVLERALEVSSHRLQRIDRHAVAP